MSHLTSKITSLTFYNFLRAYNKGTLLEVKKSIFYQKQDFKYFVYFFC